MSINNTRITRNVNMPIKYTPPYTHHDRLVKTSDYHITNHHKKLVLFKIIIVIDI